jgi:RimJ/RimL family protein N-acetyltransferase
MVTMEPIATASLVLVPIEASQAAAIIAGDFTGLKVAEGWPHEDTADGLSMAVAHGHPAGWMVVLNGEVIGDCGTHGPIDPAGVIEIGYGLASGYRGRGYGTELVQAMTAYLLGRGALVVRARTTEDNAASRGVLDKAGFTVSNAEQNGNLVFERGQ